MRITPFRFLVMLSMAVALSACGGGGGSGGAQPSVLQVSPGEGLTAGGDLVRVIGSGFGAGVSAVLVGGQPADNVVVESDTALTCRVPPGAPGPQEVAVTTSGGLATLPGGFVYVGTIAGRYTRVTFRGVAGSVSGGLPSARASWGAALAEALTGAVSSDLLTHESDAGIDVTGVAEDYVRLSDGRVGLASSDDEWIGGTGNGGASGSLSEVVALASVRDAPGISVLVSPGLIDIPPASSPNVALDGDYAMVLYGFASPGRDTASFAKLTFDGAGGISSFTLTTNANGSVAPTTPSVTGTYSVDADGQVAFTVGSISLAGGMHGRGEVVVLAGSADGSVNQQVIAFLVPLTTGATAALFQGRYHAVMMSSARVPPVLPDAAHFHSLNVVVLADGVGAFQFEDGVGLENVDGDVRVPVFSRPGLPVPSIPFAIAVDGSLIAPSAGAVSPDGRFVIMATIQPGDAPSVWFMVRED